jgi:hypothetical protein
MGKGNEMIEIALTAAITLAVGHGVRYAELSASNWTSVYDSDWFRILIRCEEKEKGPPHVALASGLQG